MVSLAVLWYYLAAFLIWGVFAGDVSGFRSISGWEGLFGGYLARRCGLFGAKEGYFYTLLADFLH